MREEKMLILSDEARREAIRILAKERGYVIAVEEDGSEWLRIEDVCCLVIESKYNLELNPEGDNCPLGEWG